MLLWPFLSQFFKNLGLLHNKEFTDGIARERAALLLQYLATGTDEANEAELSLNKVLCGLPLDEPIDPVLEPNKSESDAAYELLRVIIQQWQALKNISVARLRNDYLLRTGFLSQTAEKAYKLHVERKNYDVLIDKIPWPLNTVKLPWMEAIINLEWKSKPKEF